MKLILRDRNLGMADAWEIAFKGVPNVEIGHGDIFDVKADAIVSPANSFAHMDGGIDMVYTNRFGWGLSANLQKELFENHYGELLVGEALIIPIDNDPDYKYLVSAPTMRVPMDINGSVNAFLAMRAVLIEVNKFNSNHTDQIHTVLCPGLGTAVGRLPYDIAASQMREAYRVVMENQPLQFEQLAHAYGYHERLRRGMV